MVGESPNSIGDLLEETTGFLAPGIIGVGYCSGVVKSSRPLSTLASASSSLKLKQIKEESLEAFSSKCVSCGKYSKSVRGIQQLVHDIVHEALSNIRGNTPSSNFTSVISFDNLANYKN